MLTKLTSNDIARLWDLLKLGLKESVPPYVLLRNDTLNTILDHLLTDHMQCWISHKRVEEDKELEIFAFIFTTFFIDNCSYTKSLMIYAIYGTTLIPEREWKEGVLALYKYAKEKKCDQIVGHTSNKVLIDRAIEFGGNAEYTYITIPI